MGNQFLSIYEETTRGVTPGSPARLFVPVLKGIEPNFKPKDESRKEFRGNDTALGDASVLRRESQFTSNLELAALPGAETGLFLKHLFGFAGTRATVDVSGKKGMLYPKAMPYGTGMALVDKAIALEPNLDRDGVTASQKFAGYRPKSATIAIKPGGDITISFEGQGAGAWVGAPNQAAVGGVSFPTNSPFLFNEAAFYIGTGITRTGTAPDFTDIAPGTMAQFMPDECTIKINNGLDDKTILNGVAGPSKTERVSQFGSDIEFTLDFRDPATGFSSIDEFEATFTGPRTNSLLVVLTSSVLAGSATEKYKWVLDFPLVLLEADPPERDNEGKQQKCKMKWKTLYSSVTAYPVAMLTVDKAAAY